MMLRITKLKNLYRTLSPEDYLFNQRDAINAKQPQTKLLGVLENANMGQANVTDEIALVGTPKKFIEKFPEYDSFQREMARQIPDLLFLQVDPSSYIARERFAAHKCALNKVEDYYLDGVEKIDPLRPHTWEETVVNLLTLDMIVQNKIPQQLDYRKGMYAYSYPYIQDQSQTKEITEPFANAISTHVLGNKRSGYDLIDKVLYTALMGKQKVMLGGMPETLCRLILGNSLSIHQMRDIFKFVLTKNKQLTVPLSTKEACENFMPHIFQLPKDLYLTAMLKEAFQAAVEMVAFVGIEHWRPIQEYWVGPPHGINYTEATKIPDRMEGESDEDLIEKQAIMEVLMDSRVWGSKYLSNPFPYLIQDVTTLTDKESKSMKQCFLSHYKKYSLFKQRETKQLPTEGASVKQLSASQEEIRKIQDQLAASNQTKKFMAERMKAVSKKKVEQPMDVRMSSKKLREGKQ